jgi:hypothetical protein
MSKVAVLALFVLISVSVHAGDTISVKLRVTDLYTNTKLGGVSVINQLAGVTLATDAEGMVDLQGDKGTTLFLFYPGYKTTRYILTDSAGKKSYNMYIAIEPLSASLNQPVVIKAPKTLEDIEAERKKLGITPRELQKPEVVFTSPITALYDILSNRAKERDKLRQQMAEDDKRRIFKELLYYYNENGLMDLPEEYFEDFITYCNLPSDYLKVSTDYEITKTVIDLYKRYGLDRGFIK